MHPPEVIEFYFKEKRMPLESFCTSSICEGVINPHFSSHLVTKTRVSSGGRAGLTRRRDRGPRRRTRAVR